MAQPNRLRITASPAGAEVLVSNAQGQVKDVSQYFKYNQGTTTPTSNSNEFRAVEDGTEIVLTFVAKSKQLDYELEDETARQIYALGD